MKDAASVITVWCDVGLYGKPSSGMSSGSARRLCCESVAFLPAALPTAAMACEARAIHARRSTWRSSAVG